MRKATAYIAITALAALGLTALTLAANPKVSEEYRAYFIDRSTDCWLAGASGALPDTGRMWFLNAHDTAAAMRLLECGWLKPEGTGAWSSGNSARLVVRPTGPAPWTVDLDLVPFAGAGIPSQRMAIVVAGETLLDTTLVPRGKIQHRLTLAARHIGVDGRAILEFNLPDAISPAELNLNPDRRKFAVRLLSVLVRSERR